MPSDKEQVQGDDSAKECPTAHSREERDVCICVARAQIAIKDVT